MGIESGNVQVVYVTEETPRGAITIFPTLRKRMGLADTLTARSQMFHASLRLRLEHGTSGSVYAHARFLNSATPHGHGLAMQPRAIRGPLRSFHVPPDKPYRKMLALMSEISHAL